MVIVRDRRVVAILRDDEPVGGLLLRLFRLSREELRWALVELDASIVRAHPYVRDVLAAFIEYQTTADAGATSSGGSASALPIASEAV